MELKCSVDPSQSRQTAQSLRTRQDGVEMKVQSYRSGARCQVRGARSLCIRYGRSGQANVGGRSTKKVNGRLTQTGGIFPAQKFADTY